ncbi:hypothetical protein Tco_1182165 [Tanacetum coccineum]
MHVLGRRHTDIRNCSVGIFEAFVQETLFKMMARKHCEAIENQEEVHDSWLAAKDARRGEQGRLDRLNEEINDSLEEIEKLETNVEILEGVADVV